MAARSMQSKSRKNAVPVPLSGPVRATLSFGLTSKELLQQPPLPLNTGGCARSGDRSNGHHQRDVRPTSCDNLRSSSPDNPHFLSKVKNGLSLDHRISRSSSLEAVSSNFYLSGTWPRVGHVEHVVQSDIETSHKDFQNQTPKDWHAERHSSSPAAYVPYSSHGMPDDLKGIRARLKSTKEVRSTRSSPVLPFVISSLPPSVPNSRSNRRRHHKHSISHSRGSLEGLNQELETLDVMSGSATIDYNRDDGRRAPVADLLTCDVLKQLVIPTEDCSVLEVDVDDSCLKSSDSGFSSTISSLDQTLPLSTAKEARTSNPFNLLSDGNEYIHLTDEYGASPPKFILTRLPPEGCENITCKLNETISHCVQMEADAADSSKIIKPSFSKCHIPSEASAFCPPLLKKYVRQTTGMLSSTSAGQDRAVCVNNRW